MHRKLAHVLSLCGLLLLVGCATRGIPPTTVHGEQPAARALLLKSAEAHGLSAFRQITDISVGYTGEWYSLVSKLQPVLIDAGYRRSSQERILIGTGGLVAQQHVGPHGSKQVVRRAEDIKLFYNGQPGHDPEALAAAALVADAYRMFLTGPFHFLEGNLSLAVAGNEEVEGRSCLTLVAVRRPGHGLAQEDRYLLFIDAENYLLRRIRFSMEGLESTRGAIAEVDFFDHKPIAGVIWSTRFHERLRKPIPGLPVHDWWLTGLDVNRGLSEADVAGAAYSPRAAEPARLID